VIARRLVRSRGCGPATGWPFAESRVLLEAAMSGRGTSQRQCSRQQCSERCANGRTYSSATNGEARFAQGGCLSEAAAFFSRSSAESVGKAKREWRDWPLDFRRHAGRKNGFLFRGSVCAKCGRARRPMPSALFRRQQMIRIGLVAGTVSFPESFSCPACLRKSKAKLLNPAYIHSQTLRKSPSFALRLCSMQAAKRLTG
jgi:hypothetical protein